MFQLSQNVEKFFSFLLVGIITGTQKKCNEDIELHSLDPRIYLFNGQEEGDYLFGQGIINEASINDKEYLQLYESWCLFAYREFYKNLLVILDEVSLRTYGGKKQVFQTDFANSLICMMMKKYKRI